MRARNPCLLMRRRLRGRYVGPLHSSREDGKRTRSSARRSRLTFPQVDRTFGPPLLDVPPHSHSRMEQSTKEAWKRLLDEARRELPDATVRTWLEPAVPIALDDGRLIVGAPDQFAVEWNESKHANVLARAAERVFGRPTAVVFRVQEDRQQRPQMDFFGAEQFINEVIESIHARTMSEFRRRYRNDVDLFLVDDVHFLEGKEMTQEEFFHTFNALFEGHKQIVLTSDRPPKEIPGLEDRLISRFEWGLVADIGHPDLEHRIAILRKKAEQDHLELTIPDDVLRFIAEHIRSSVRELEGCIIKLLLFASLKNREVTIELAREALSDKIRQGEEAGGYGGQATPSIDRVQEVVARRWGVTPEGLRSKARTKTLTIPRQVAMYLASNMLSMQLVEIGQAFGGRDHSTAIHSVDKVERQMMRDRTFKERVEMARQELSAL